MIKAELGGRRPLHLDGSYCQVHLAFENECKDFDCTSGRKRNQFTSVWDCHGQSNPTLSCMPYNTFHLDQETISQFRRNPIQWKWLLELEKLTEKEQRSIRRSAPKQPASDDDEDSEESEDLSDYSQSDSEIGSEDETRSPIRGRMVVPGQSTYSPDSVPSVNCVLPLPRRLSMQTLPSPTPTSK